MVYDVAVIGAGVIGSFIARELSRYKLKICLIEKASDVAEGASSANSGIVHAGYDAEPGSLKARFNVLGNRMMEQVAKELGVPFKRIGSLVLAFNEEDMSKIRELFQRGLNNGVERLEILTRQQLRQMEPAVSDEAVGALYAPTAGIICPYELTLGAAENAVMNGVELKLECEVKGIRREEYPTQPFQFQPNFILSTSKGEVRSKYVVNAAGVYADVISAMAGDNHFSIKPRKGEYLLMDKNQGGIVNRVIFQPPTKMGKGILVSPTVDGNLLIGPNAVDVGEREDNSTSSSGLIQVVKGALRSVPSVNVREVITSFAGLRATPSTGDFVIGESSKVKGFINVAGIESPGLTCAPAIAGYVADILRNSGLELLIKESFSPIRYPIKKFADMDDGERAKMIKEDPRYGRIVCRCEKVTEVEIVNAAKSPVGARSLDGIKRRTRAGMGRCQGGFCSPRVMEILSRELGIPVEEITKMGGNSRILVGRTK